MKQPGLNGKYRPPRLADLGFVAVLPSYRPTDYGSLVWGDFLSENFEKVETGTVLTLKLERIHIQIRQIFEGRSCSGHSCINF